MNRYIRVDGEEHFYRDLETNAIVNRNNKEYEAYKAKAKEKKQINNLREEIFELKHILNDLVKRRTN